MPARRHSRQDVIEAAMAILDEQGLEAVTVREVARRMRVNVNTVSFQVGTKGRLLDLMADEALAGLSFDGLPDDGFERAAAIIRRARAVLLARRDGARLVAGTEPMEHNTFRLSEELLAALVSAGASDLDSVRAAWSLFYFALGLTQEQQAAAITPEVYEAAVTSADYPTLARIGHAWMELSFEDRFEFGIQAIIGAVRDNQESTD